MPIYEYQCEKCGHVFEHLARTLAAPPPVCPKCGARKPKKQLSVFSAGSSENQAPACAAESCPAAGSCPSGRCPLI